MNGEFERLLYTDCRAGAGRGAGGGFQIQAQSVGVDPAQARMAVGWLLYETQQAWVMERRPVEEFPLGFAHACEGGYGTAQGRYVGRESVGARDGNHLTDCLLTRDPECYGSMRPAQLWRSDLWRTQAWDDAQCPRLAGLPEPGPLGVAAIADWLRACPERNGALKSLLTVLEDVDGPRVLMTAQTPDEAMEWIAAATLLLPMRVALDVSFKVFGASVNQARHRVVALPRELHQAVVPGRYTSSFVLDASAGACDRVEPSARAEFWVERLADAGDPYDVVDAVELVEMLAGARTSEARTLVTAWALAAPDAPLLDVDALCGWLQGAAPDQQMQFGARIVGRILEVKLNATMLRWIDQAVADGAFVADRRAIRRGLLDAELGEVRAGHAPPSGLLAPLEVAASPDGELQAHGEGAATQDDAQCTTGDEVSAEIEASGQGALERALLVANDREVDAALQLARRHGIDVRLGPVRERMWDFVVAWVDHPERRYEPTSWARRDDILDLVHQELNGRLAARGSLSVRAFIARWWPLLEGRGGDPVDPLECEFAAAALVAGRGDRRAARVGGLLRQALGAQDPERALGDLQRALLAWKAVGPLEAEVIVCAVPAALPVEPEVAEVATAGELGERFVRPTHSFLDTLHCLDRRGVVLADRRAARLLRSDREIIGFVKAAATVQSERAVEALGPTLKALGEADPAVLRLRLESILHVMLACSQPALGAAVLTALPPQEASALIALWSRELGASRSLRPAAAGAAWTQCGLVRRDLLDRIAAELVGAWRAQKPAERTAWVQAISPHSLPAAWWEDLVAVAGSRVPPSRQGWSKA